MTKDKVDLRTIEAIGRDLLIALGENPEREGIKETPARWARWWKEFIEYDPGKITTSFQGIDGDQMIVVTGIRVWSLCEHHLLPFYSDLTIGYVPSGKVLGLSKLARIAHKYAHQLQIQERLTQQIADDVSEMADTRHVGVIASGKHLCMIMRGIKTDATMKTSTLKGLFFSGETRNEFFAMHRDND